MHRLLLIALLLLSTTAARARERDVDVMTFNIRCGSCEQPDDVNHWSRRQTRVVALIAKYQPDLIGLQEAERYQIHDLVEALGDYAWFGVGRDDGQAQGEATAILYRKARFQRLSQQTRWLSPTPEVVGKGWDAALNRTVSIVHLRDLKSRRELWMFNAHFDHLGEQARIESSKLVVALTQSLAGEAPVILTGDFNYTPASAGYPIVAAQLQDAARVSQEPPQGGDISFNGFGHAIVPGNKIDYIFVNAGFDVHSHRIITELHDGLYPSDHYPLLARLRLK